VLPAGSTVNVGVGGGSLVDMIVQAQTSFDTITLLTAAPVHPAKVPPVGPEAAADNNPSAGSNFAARRFPIFYSLQVKLLPRYRWQLAARGVASIAGISSRTAR